MTSARVLPKRGPPWRAVVALLGVITACADVSTESPTTFQLQAVATIGTVGGDGPEAFGDITGLEIGDDGSLFVLDGLNRVVQVFDQTGVHLRSIGGRGSGPGEFENPVALALSPAGDLWVVDTANRRYTVFDQDGALLATYVRAEAGVVLPWPGGFTADGHFFDVTFVLESEGISMWLLRLEVTDAEVIEVDRFELPIEDIPAYEYEGAGVALMLPIPFTRQPLNRIARDGGLYEANTGAPWVRWRSFGSDASRTFGREVDPVPVTDEEIERALDTEDTRGLRALGGAEALAELAALIPATKPPLSGFFADDEGRLWIMRPSADSAPTPRSFIDVYDPDGVLVGTTEATILPDPWPRLRGGVLAAVTRNALDVESLVVFRVQ